MGEGEEMTRRVVALLVAFVVLESVSEADVGLPMLAYYVPPAWLFLLPVVGVEALVGSRWFKVPPGLALRASAIANGVSTLIGVPVAWALVAGLELRIFARSWSVREPSCIVQATAQALWILPPVRACAWVFPAAAAVAAVCFYIFSVATEGLLLRWVAPTVAAESRWRWSLAANATSYALLLLLMWPLQMPAFEWAWNLLNGAAEPFMKLALLLGGLVRGR
jgi:hypothetical protein